MRYCARRLAHSVFLLLGVSFLSFALTQFAPGSFFDEMKLNPQISPATVADLRHQYGLDEPIWVRYSRWVKSAARGELGFSFAYNAPVAPLLIRRSGNTLLLTGTAMLLAWMIALPLGIFAAERRHGVLDQACSLATSAIMATPELLLTLAFLLLAVRTRWFPTGGMFTPGAQPSGASHCVDLIAHLAGPAIIVALGSLPALLRHTRAAMLEVLQSPYIRAARAHGLTRGRILFFHALPAALNPLISLGGVFLAYLLSGSLLVEVVLGWPGLGPFLLEAILARDFYVVIDTAMFSAALLVVGMLISDILLFVADPRIRTEGLT